MTYREVASRYGTSTTTIQRHRKNHLAQQVAKAVVERAEVKAQVMARHSMALLDQLKELQQQALRLSVKAEVEKDWQGAIGAVREMRRLVELLAKMTGELEWAPPPALPGPSTTVNVLLQNPDWMLLQRKIISALQPFPAARDAVLKAIRSVEEPPPPPASDAAAAQVVELAVIGPGPNRIEPKQQEWIGADR